MPALILHRHPAATPLWLGETARRLELPMPGLVALHVAAPSPSSTLILEGAGWALRQPAREAGWTLLGETGDGPFAIRAEGPPVRLTCARDAAPATPACRLWRLTAADEGAVPETHWHAAAILGPGRLAQIGAGPARPLLRLGAGEAAWITLPPFPLTDEAEPVLAVLRGHRPLARLSGGGEAPVTLSLQAPTACELVWEGIQLRPKSRANSA
ncbi:hypothetical protein [Roseococcus sp. YIM B11640]|uniref:hypothetical protein n=1 Tax=Roseococcus sp. YIM B11640 TaxID=3133973 RepID=UPI003C7C4060